MNRRTQAGFAPILIIVLIVAVLGVAAFVVVRMQTPSPTTQTQQTPEQTPEPEEEKTEETPAVVTYTTYKSTRYPFQIDYPSTWNKIADVKSDLGDKHTESVPIRSPDYETKEEVIGTVLASGIVLKVDIEPTTVETAEAAFKKNQFLVAEAKNKESVKIAKHDGVRYTVQYETLQATTTTLVHKGQLYSITYEFPDTQTQAAYRSTYDAFAASFKLTD